MPYSPNFPLLKRAHPFTRFVVGSTVALLAFGLVSKALGGKFFEPAVAGALIVLVALLSGLSARKKTPNL